MRPLLSVVVQSYEVLLLSSMLVLLSLCMAAATFASCNSGQTKVGIRHQNIGSLHFFEKVSSLSRTTVKLKLTGLWPGEGKQ